MGSSASANPAEAQPQPQPATRARLSELLVIRSPLTDAHRARLAPHFATITHYPDPAAPPPADAYARADVVFGFPPADLRSRAQVPRLQFVQLGSAGSEEVLKSPMWKEEGAKDIGLATSAGVHTGPIPQYFIATTLMLYHKLQEQVLISQVEKRWGTDVEVGGGNLWVRELRGKTVGVLGYGHIGRESARLAAAFGAQIIAANSSGTRTAQDGYIIPGTGDPDGAIPSAWYSTRAPASFAAFLARSDVLLLALPSTPLTRHILSASALSHLKPSALLINIGRGDAVDTSALVAALDGGRLAGAALDVTDPEPLPAGHTLYGRRNVVLTPHQSGRTEIYFDLAYDILLANVARWERGERLLNAVDVERGY